MEKLSEVQKVLEQTAAEVAREETIAQWGPRLIYLLGALEEHIHDQKQLDEYKTMLDKLRHDIGERLFSGTW